MVSYTDALWAHHAFLPRLTSFKEKSLPCTKADQSQTVCNMFSNGGEMFDQPKTLAGGQDEGGGGGDGLGRIFPHPTLIASRTQNYPSKVE